MVQSTIFIIPEVLEHILHFLSIDKSLYPSLYVFRLWYRCGAPILWRRIELNESSKMKKFIKLVRREEKPIYSSKLTHLEIRDYHLSDKKFKNIAGLFPNIVHLNLRSVVFSVRFSDKTLNRIAES